MKYSHSEVKTGIVVVAALAVFLTLIVILGKFEQLFREKYDVVFLFSQVAGLKEGAPVRYGGVDIGYVYYIDDRVERAETGEEIFLVELHSKIDSRYKLTSGDKATIGSRITGDAWVEVQPGEGRILEDGDELLGTPGYTLTEIQDKLVHYMDSVEGFFRENRAKVADTIENVRQATEDMKSASARFREIVEVDVKSVLTDAKESAAGVKEVVAENKEKASAAISDFKETSENIKSASAELKDIIEANRGRIESIVARLEDTSEKVGNAADRIEEFSVASKDILAENRTNIKRTVSNLRDTAANLKFASDDLRRHPWKLLHRPNKQEMDEWAVYAAAIDFSNGAQHLGNAFYDLSGALTAHEKLTPEQAQELQEILERTKALLDDFAEYEQGFYEKLTGK
jgi:phospholipid/cholesterol/gamma-HCH transport system substrate-binding protein